MKTRETISYKINSIRIPEFDYSAENYFSNVGADLRVCPNHIHAIIVLNSQVCAEKTTHRVVSTTLKSSSLGSIIGQIKSITTKRIRKLTNNPEIKIWQPRFYEHIIRNAHELYEIRQYIQNNPLKWSEDEYNL